jgi:hypothetical protein
MTTKPKHAPAVRETSKLVNQLATLAWKAHRIADAAAKAHGEDPNSPETHRIIENAIIAARVAAGAAERLA